MMTFRTEDPISCGTVEFVKENIVIAFLEKVNNPLGNLASRAIYILSQQEFQMLRLDFKNANDFSREIIDNFVGRIFSY